METSAGCTTLNLLAVGLSYRRLLVGLATLHFSCLLWWPDASTAVAGLPDRRIRRGLSHQLPPADEAAFIILLSDSERAEYTSLRTPEERAAWRRGYWNQRDPTPGTERNERYEEHLRRVAYARTMYSWPNSRGFDDRGEIYVRYGEPDDRYICDTPTPGWRSNESWVYNALGFYGCFDFVDDGSGYFRLARSLREATTGSHADAALERLYAARADLAPFYAEIHRQMVDARYRGLSPGLVVDLASNEREMHRAELPAELAVYLPELRSEKPFDFPLYSAVFLRPKGWLAEIYYGLPAEGASRGEQHVVQVQFALFDSSWNDLLRWKRPRRFQGRLRNPSRQQLFVDVLRVMLKQAGRYQAMLGVVDSAGRRRAVYRFPLQTSTLANGVFGLSDIELAYHIEPGTHPKFAKPGLVVIPNPARRYRRDQPCWLYFEVYNLALDPSGRSHYRTTLTLTRLGRNRLKRRGLFSRLAGIFRGQGGRSELSLVSEAHGTSRTEYVSLQLDIHRLAPGEYRLTVRVDDLEAGETASRGTKLWIAE